MNKSHFARLTIVSCCCVVLIILAMMIRVSAQSGNSGTLKTGISPVKTFDGTSVIPAAGATLSRNNEAVFGNISTSGLAPGTVVTLWWVFFNTPQYCAIYNCGPSDLNIPDVNGSLQYGGGAVVGAGGRADFSGYFQVGDNTGFYRLPMFPSMPNPAPGLVNPKGAIIHLVIRTHGPVSANPVTLNEQLTTFPGGCSVVPNPCSNIQVAIFR